MAGFDYGIVRNPEIFMEGRLPAHSDHEYFGSPEAARRGESGFRASLGGFWKFAYARNYALAAKDFYREDFDCRGWDEIRVPAHIQMEGYGAPQYVNTEYPWDGREEVLPGEIPEIFNPVGSYVRYFRLPANMRTGPVYISFQGVESGMALWLNGSYVGYSEDSFTPSEFDLTPYIDRDGENKLAVMVFRFTAGSWCEDQDFFRFSGIFRDVYLYTVPAVHIRDLRVETLLDDDYRDAELVLTLKMTAPGHVLAELLDGETVAANAEGTAAGGEDRKADAEAEAAGSGNGILRLSVRVTDPKKWSAEYPNLYGLRLTVSDADGKFSEIVTEHVGFRRFEMIDRVMCLNGKRIVFYGVNRHEFSAESGRCIRDEDILKDVLTMKRNNINAVRTCHYPNRTLLYRLCDEYGLYMIDEMNLETHGVWNAIISGQKPLEFAVPGDRPEYMEMILDRARSMFERDKNHPAVLIWSLGNESFGGTDLLRLHDAFHSWDSSRPVHYEGIQNDRRYPETTDIESTMYTPAADIRRFLGENRTRPYILCEYAHAMGNSCGALWKYTDLINEDPLFQGGFIWDFIDQSITRRDRNGREFQAYGGDFGDRPNDGSFSGNGIVYGKDREPSPKMQEVKCDYRAFDLTFDGDSLVVTNRSLFTNASAFTCRVTVEREGRLLETWNGRISVPPVGNWPGSGMTDLLRSPGNARREDSAPAYIPRGEAARHAFRGGEDVSGKGEGFLASNARMPLPVRIPEEPGEYVVTASLLLSEDSAWAGRGHEIAWGQKVFRVSGNERGQGISCPASAEPCPPLRISRGWSNVGAAGDDFEVLFSDLFGGMTSYRRGSREFLARMPKPNFWRPMNENDTASLLPFRAGQWKLASMYSTTRTSDARGMTPCGIREEDGCLSVSFTYHLATKPAKDCLLRYTVRGSGAVDVCLAMEPSDEVGEMPEFSVIFPMDASYSRLRWYGLGPEETYADRNHAKLGVYTRAVEENMAKYLVPSECGNHTGVRWAEITDDSGAGLRIEAVPGEELSLSVLPFSPHEIDCAAHPNELPPVLYTWVRVGLAQMGVGGDDTWGARTHPEFLIDNSKRLELTFTMKGVPEKMT